MDVLPSQKFDVCFGSVTALGVVKAWARENAHDLCKLHDTWAKACGYSRSDSERGMAPQLHSPSKHPAFGQGGHTVLHILEGLLVDLRCPITVLRAAHKRSPNELPSLGVQHVVDGIQLGLEVLSIQVALLLHLLDCL